MDIWHVRGGKRLEGECRIQGSKNAALPVLAAALLGRRSELINVPALLDVDAAIDILRHLGCTAYRSGGRAYIDAKSVSSCSIPHELMAKMRSSVIFMGALIARCGEARLSLPGGCQLGARPIDLHLRALRAMGADIEEDGEEIHCLAHSLHGAVLHLPFPSVGATENIMLSACGAKGDTVIHGAAREPEIAALQGYLNAIGAKVSGAGSDTVYISPIKKARDAAWRIMPDRIVAATIECACALCGGDIRLSGADSTHFSTVNHFLNEAGCAIINNERSLRVISDGALRSVGRVETAPYPGFPTDAQSVLMSALLKSRGESVIVENIFENRFRHVPELEKLGADIVVDGKAAHIRGVRELHGAMLNATDLRGAAAMIVAAMAAEGSTVIFDDDHVRRGYEEFDSLLRSLGADVYLE